MHAVPMALLSLAALSTLLTLSMHFATRAVLRRRRRRAVLQPVSILKPLRGIDDGLAENLESFARQDYPDYEILLGAEDPLDPALPLARAFARRHPERRIEVLVCDRSSALNPKVRVLETLAGAARNDLLLISDSNVRAEPCFLAATAGEMGPEVGLVTSPVVGVGEQRLGAAMENAHLNSFIMGAIAWTVFFARQSCVLGKSMLFRKSEFDRLIGWPNVRAILAEDYIIGRRFEKAGRKVVLASHPLYTVNSTWGVGRFLARHVRWCQIRRRIATGPFLAELLLNPTPFIALALAAAVAAGEREWVLASALLLVTKVASDVLLARRLGAQPPSPAVVVLKDLMIPGVWLTGAFKRTVIWRGNVRRLYRFTRLAAGRPAGTRPELRTPASANSASLQEAGLGLRRA